MKNSFLLLLLGLCCSCDGLFLEEDRKKNAVDNFQLCWQLLDENYCFFNEKNLNWNEVYSRYSDSIQINTDPVRLFDYLANMLHELKDGHVNLRSDFDLSRNWDWNLDFPKNFDIELLKQEKYLGKDYRIAGGFYTDLIQDIPYFYFPSFQSSINTGSLDLYLEAYNQRDVPGLILDLRNNGGGLISNIKKIANRFVSKKTLVGYRRFKAGKGHQDFSQKFPQYLTPTGQNGFSQKPVYVLTNRSVYSAANELAAILSLLPNVRLIGDQTGGGGGMPVSNQLYNGWSLRYSAHQYLLPDGSQIELGVQPDIPVNITRLRQLLEEDDILNTALAALKGRVSEN